MSLLSSHTDNPTFRNASYILMGLALLIVLHYHFLPLLLSVILTYIFITRTNGVILKLRRRVLPRNTRLHKSLNAHNINLISTTLTLAIVFSIITMMSLGIYHLIHGGHVGFMLGEAGGDFGRHQKQPRPACGHSQYAAQQYGRNQSLGDQAD